MAFCKTNIRIIGYISVVVRAKQIERKLNIYITDIDRKPLLDREWIRQLSIFGGLLESLNCNAVENSNNKMFQLKNMLEKYKDVRSAAWSKITGVKAKLMLTPKTAPVFLKARLVPFKLVALIDKELDELAQAGVLIKVETSDWATPIVPILKADGRVRICGDYKATVNPQVIVDEHPLPTINEIFSKLAGGKKFSKIDLRQAYLQLEVNSRAVV